MRSTRRMSKPAPVRNRAKRRLRALAARVLPSSAREGHDYVLIARTGTLSRRFSELEQDLSAALRHLHAGFDRAVDRSALVGASHSAEASRATGGWMVGDSTGTSAGGASTESTARAARGMAGSASTMAAASPAASKAPRAGCNNTFFNCTWKLSEVQTDASNPAASTIADRRPIADRRWPIADRRSLSIAPRDHRQLRQRHGL